jgi:hypothetical protein
LCAGDVGTNNVALDDMALRRDAEKHYSTIASVSRDQITWRRARSGCQAADKVVSALRIYAYVRVGYGNCAGDIRADEVPLHRVVRATPGVNATVIAGNDITSIDCCAADEVTTTAGTNPYACVSQRQRAGDIGADQIALYRVAGAIPQRNATADIS